MERQEAQTLEGIREDHVSRYRLAAEIVSGAVLDLACGCGYGSKILHDAGCQVTGVDCAEKAILYARRHYSGPLYVCDSADTQRDDLYDFAVCFETVEHIAGPQGMLQNLRRTCKGLLVSAPSIKFEANRFPFHHRHYQQEELADLLVSCGWKPLKWWGQPGAYDAPIEGRVDNCRTVIALCE